MVCVCVAHFKDFLKNEPSTQICHIHMHEMESDREQRESKRKKCYREFTSNKKKHLQKSQMLQMQKKSKQTDREWKNTEWSQNASQSISVDLIWTHCFTLPKPSFWITMCFFFLVLSTFCFIVNLSLFLSFFFIIISYLVVFSRFLNLPHAEFAVFFIVFRIIDGLFSCSVFKFIGDTKTIYHCRFTLWPVLIIMWF